MTPEILEWLADTAAKHIPLPGDVFELGSLDVNGSARTVFPHAARYVGVDMRAGEGVDYVLHSSEIVNVFGRETFDTVLCLETLEHDLRFWQTVPLLKALLKPGGALVITTPNVGFPYHPYPRDYYRFTTDVYEEVFFAGMQLLRLTTISGPAGPHSTVAGAARK